MIPAAAMITINHDVLLRRLCRRYMLPRLVDENPPWLGNDMSGIVTILGFL